jgi:hypothetical protein
MSLHVPTLTAGRQASAAPAEAFAPRRLALATAVALGGSLAAVLVTRSLAVSATSATSRFSPLAAGSVISLTVLGVLLAGASCLWLERTSKRPVAAFRAVALKVLGLSFIPDLVVWIARPFPQTRAATVLPLMAMHVLVAGVCLVVLPRLGRARAER